ncbi:hypothetical protein K2X30_12255 [bacterium]|jgi:hypothetical protein|nr:hypothetical protein [bacterium]
MSTVHRFFQFAYTTVIFFSLFLAWSSVGPANGFADFPGYRFDQNHSNRGPAQVQATCSITPLSFLNTKSCKEEGAEFWKLIDTNRISGDSTQKADYKTFPPQPQLN